MSDYVSPDWSNAALLTIDTQQDFTLPGAPAEIPGTAEVVPGIRRLVQAFREQNRPIIHAIRIYRPDGSNVDLCRRRDIERGKRVVLPGSDGAELVDELKPSPVIRLDAERLLAGDLQPIGPMEWIMYKPRWGAFYQTSLGEHLAELHVNTVVICGCNFPNCPRATIYEASERDLRVVFVTDATSGVYERGLQELQNIGVELVYSSQLFSRLDKASSAARLRRRVEST
jgi:nicotinamidase-related amidase